MVNRKINKLLCSVLGVVLTFGVMEMPALAADNSQASLGYSASSSLGESKNCIISKNNSIEKNGLKISIDSIVATKHSLKAVVLVENQKPFDKDRDKFADLLLTYGNNKFHSQSESYDRKDEKTYKITFEREVEDELPEKGSLRVDIVIPKYKVNVGMDVDVDFTEAFKNSIEKEMSVKVPETNVTINKVESNILGTQITYSEPEKDFSDRIRGASSRESVRFILKVGDKMYPVEEHGSHSTGNGNGDNSMMIGAYEAEEATYDKVKDQSNVSLIPVVCNITSDEIKEFYKDSGKNKEDNKDALNNVNYTKNIDFSDGSKGEIYNIERNNDNLKIYCKGATEKESLLIASNMFMYYKIGEEKENDDFYSGNRELSIYKDPKDSLGYIVEFNNVKADKTVELNYNRLISKIDKYTIGSEIQLAK